MWKKILTLIIVSAFSIFSLSRALAGGPDAANPFKGFYTGIQFGAGNAQFFNDFSIAAPTFIDPLRDDKGSDGGTGFLIGAELGYSSTVRHFYWGVEIQGAFNTMKTIFISTGGTTDFPQKFTNRMKNSYGIQITPGVLVGHTALIYALAGLVWARISAEVNFFPVVNINQTRSGYRFGGGFATQVYRSLMLRFEYAYTAYSNIFVFGSGFSPGNPILLEVGRSMKIRANRFVLRLDYYFR